MKNRKKGLEIYMREISNYFGIKKLPHRNVNEIKKEIILN